MLDVVSLFSGIEGFGLGLERTGGFRVVAQVEQDPYCLSVLERHWPHVPRFTDVREVGAHNLPRADVVTGGFPCQDISGAGRRAGIDGERSGLWAEMFRIIGELRPRYVLVENVADLAIRGLDRVLGDLATLGFDAEWDCLRASDVGAPHARKRIWIVAYPQGDGRGPGRQGGSSAGGPRQPEPFRALQDAIGARPGLGHVADSGSVGCERRPRVEGDRREPAERCGAIGDARDDGGGSRGSWTSEPSVGRVADGVPDWVDRMRSLGNALVPQIPEWIGYRILEWEGRVDGT